ncbi:diguanylate cyclase, partial [Candidatus Woesearchaeota archaeon]|nr:diguanylate cyclase [Candidatus Woesearchaeota archaeon]
MTIFENLNSAIVRFTDFQLKVVRDHRLRELKLKAHKIKAISLKKTVNRKTIEELKNEVREFQRYLEIHPESEGKKGIDEDIDEEEKILGIVESDTLRLRKQISELPIGDVRDELLLIIPEIEEIIEPMKRLNKINSVIERILDILGEIIEKEREALVTEYNLLVHIENNEQGGVNSEVEELIGAIEYLELNLQREQDNVIKPMTALTDQKKEVQKKIEDLKKGLNQTEEAYFKRIKNDIRNLSPLQVEEYLKLLQEIHLHYIISGNIFEKIKVAQRFLGLFKRIFTKRRAKFETEKDIESAGRLKQAKELATIDPLTGLYNRRTMTEEGLKKVKILARKGGVLGFMMIDIDFFKSVNDTWGHQTGDDVIKIVSEVIKEILREEDSAFRYGGEEMAILLSNGADESKLLSIGNRLRDKVTNSVE